jgi:hypothetical protein
MERKTALLPGDASRTAEAYLPKPVETKIYREESDKAIVAVQSTVLRRVEPLEVKVNECYRESGQGKQKTSYERWLPAER